MNSNPADYFKKAVTLQISGQIDSAIEYYRRIIGEFPGHADSYFNMGHALKGQGKFHEAISCYDSVLRINPHYPNVHHDKGVVYHCQGKLDDAINCYRNSIKLEPQNKASYFNMGNALINQGAFHEAIICYDHVLELNPQCYDAYYDKGIILYKMGLLPEAMSCFLKAINLKPDHVDALNNIALIYRETADPQQAVSYLYKAIGLRPDHAILYNNLGNALQDLGRIDEAIINFKKAIELRPNYIEAIENLTACKKFSEGDDEFSILEDLNEDPLLLETDKKNLHFALGKMYADIGDYDRSFDNYYLANEYRKKTTGEDFDPIDFEKDINRYISLFNQDFFSSRENFGVHADFPIFIVGMPRSGTTLVEQIVSSHQQVYGAGERTEIRTIAKQILSSPEENGCEDKIKGLNFGFYLDLANTYFSTLKKLSGDSPRVTDKLPQNFLHLWLIAILFPRAKIIHCMRDPYDTCLSCYFTSFVKEHSYKNDLIWLGKYYSQYQRLMQHWHEVLPLEIYDVQYEKLVEDTETMTRRILKFCDLEWDPMTLDFYKNRRKVSTASNLQVRQKIYSSSIGRWKKYQKFLQPLFDSISLG